MMFERPLLSKADVQIRVLKIGFANGWFGPESSQSPDMMANDCL